MTLTEQVKTAIHLCMTSGNGCKWCPYDRDDNGLPKTRERCIRDLLSDFDLLISDMENTIKLLEEKE